LARYRTGIPCALSVHLPDVLGVQENAGREITYARVRLTDHPRGVELQTFDLAERPPPGELKACPLLVRDRAQIGSLGP
jgi:hypothetical protein